MNKRFLSESLEESRKSRSLKNRIVSDEIQFKIQLLYICG